MFSLIIRMFEFPLMLAGLAATVAILCGFCRCSCRMRDWDCIKRCLRLSGLDEFDDFELTVLVHEAMFERKEDKLSTFVRIGAGYHSVRTEKTSKMPCVFMQPLNVLVEQGASEVSVDLLDSSERVLAKLKFDVVRDLIRPEILPADQVYAMRQKSSGIRNPRIKLTMVANKGDDLEAALCEGGGSELEWLVRQQLSKVGDVGNQDALSAACAGPLELFEGMGTMGRVYVAVRGPPESRKRTLGVWRDQAEFENRQPTMVEVDMLKIQAVQADPSRTNVFVVNYYDEHRVNQKMQFRRIDRARDVWVEILQRVIAKAHESRKSFKELKRSRTGASSGSGDRRGTVAVALGGSSGSADLRRGTVTDVRRGRAAGAADGAPSPRRGTIAAGLGALSASARSV